MSEDTTTDRPRPAGCSLCDAKTTVATVQFSVMPDTGCDYMVLLVRTCDRCAKRATYLSGLLVKQAKANRG